MITKANRKDFKELIALMTSQKEKIFVRNDMIQFFRQYCDANKKTKRFREQSSIFSFIKRIQELFVCEEQVFLMHRFTMAKCRHYLISMDGEQMEEIDSFTYLDMKDFFVHHTAQNGIQLKLDFMPFYDFSPTIKDIKSVGNGIRYLNRYLSSNIFSRSDEWNTKLFDFIKLHKNGDKQLLVNGGVIKDFYTFRSELETALRWLRKRPAKTPYSAVETKLRKSGFEAGWGNTAGRMVDTMQMLIDLLNEPTGTLLEGFISRVPLPLISKIAIISPHGWFGQTNVLGKPDTGGQVIYILDQVRALEKNLIREIELTGLTVTPKILVVTRLIPDAQDTTCNKKREKIFHTENSWIIRVPFRDREGNIVKHWISRFKIWPYLENFAESTATELTGEFQGRPDLIIGNYSDGNLVASLLSDRFDVIQCTIAHALEKTKYAFSDLLWDKYEEDYHFSLQFTADLFSMNKSDFIITSTHQEIIGTEDTIGQYEAYQSFTMPDLYQVVNGINLYAPKFNVIPPGVDDTLYFPYDQQDRRVVQKKAQWEQRLFTDETDDIFGLLDDPDKPAIFTMARLDRIKNISGLIEAYGMSPKTQEAYNLIFAAGTIHIEASKDMEERNEISKVYRLIEQYNLFGSIRWLPSINKLETGEVYRVIADHRGVFVQPALFEAFGLTIIEAMATGLPTFGPKFGGPLEIIEHGVSGLLLNTSKPELISISLEAFCDRCKKDPSFWDTISRNGIERVEKHFSWKLYSQRLINLAKLYGFWRYSESGIGMIELDRYCDLIYQFLIKDRSLKIQ